MAFPFTNDAQCPCGTSKFRLSKTPTRRFICHCTICQGVYRQPFADVTVMSAARVAIDTPETIEFGKYKEGPALDRGICKECNNPVVGFLPVMPFVRLAFVPCTNIQDQDALPDPAMHIYYDSRVADIDDALPKIEGDKKSQRKATGLVLAGFLGI